MRDEISANRVANLHPAVRDEVIATIAQIEAGFPPNIKVRVVQGLRTIAEQNALYAQGRTKPGAVVTNAKGGKSYHNFGLALDYAIMYDKDGNGEFEELSWNLVKDGDKDGRKDWDEVREAFEAKGWKWGGKWRTLKDYPHLQKTFGFTTSQLFKKYNIKEFIPGTEYVKIAAVAGKSFGELLGEGL